MRPEGRQGDERLLVPAAVRQASAGRVSVHGPALAAEERPRPAGGAGGGAIVGLFEQAVRQDHAGAGLGGGGGPDGVLGSFIVLDGVAAVEAAKAGSWPPLPNEAPAPGRTLSKKCWPQLRQVSTGKKASSWRPACCSLPSLKDRNRSIFGAFSAPSRATTISSRPRRKKWTLGLSNESPFPSGPPAPAAPGRTAARRWPCRPAASAGRHPLRRGPCRGIEACSASARPAYSEKAYSLLTR